ncbi:type III PLP-dependent enzyme [Arenibaculum pallidiluteum]|uniref:type III PLP-dependent enzyme n=1 Tax=Arenibaculum pallidiluteum TaxID=2812559 RepID=UPI001F20FEAC|nr:type III PLP-dependent enzyme [Arenibaculum pallidiluteum]
MPMPFANTADQLLPTGYAAPGSGAAGRYPDAAAMVSAIRPDQPIYCFRPHVLRATARNFIDAFPGRVLYAVKCNAEPIFVDALRDGGVCDFDTASLTEVALVRDRYADSRAYFMHPVKQRGAIREAYYRYGVRHFALDHPDELAKIRQETGDADDVTMMVRLATPRGAAVYDLGGKFGTDVAGCIDLLRAVQAGGQKAGLCFHVGSQCLTPSSWATALRLADEVLRGSGVPVSVLDVGGGFPAPYVGLYPPPLDAYVAAIRDALPDAARAPGCELWCEPGRALVAAGASLVVRVELRRAGFLYINDGIYGSLSDLKYAGLRFPMRVLRAGGRPSGRLAPFSLFGPTCDSADVMEGPYMLAEDVREGDYIEIGQAGAYTLELRTDFNGFLPDRFVEVTDPAFLPMPAMEPTEATARAAE